MAEDRQPGRQAALEILHPKRSFGQVAFDVQTISPRTKAGNIKVLAVIDVFTRFVRPKPISEEKADIIAKALVEEWISLFGPMEQTLSDGGTALVGTVLKDLTEVLGISGVKARSLHPQANGTVERRNRTLARNIASSIAAGDSDWDEHEALSCFRYNTGVCAATGMTPFQALFGVDTFEHGAKWTECASMMNQTAWPTVGAVASAGIQQTK